MISDEKLRALVGITATDVEKDEFASSSMRSTLVHELCTELLQRREAEHKAASWEDAPSWAVSRRPSPRRVKWVYYDEANTQEIRQGRIALDTLEERPK